MPYGFWVTLFANIVIQILRTEAVMPTSPVQA